MCALPDQKTVVELAETVSHPADAGPLNQLHDSEHVKHDTRTGEDEILVVVRLSVRQTNGHGVTFR